MTRPLRFLAGALDAQQRAVADAGDFTRPGAARGGDVDDRGRAVRLLVPFGRPRQQFAVAVAAGDVGEHDRRQGAGAVQPLPVPFDMTAFGQLAQHALECGAVGILGAEGARDLAGADIAGALADEGKELLARGQGGSFHRPLIGRVRPKNTAMARCVGLFGSLRGLAWCFAEPRAAWRRLPAGRLDEALMCLRGAGRRALGLARPRVRGGAVALGDLASISAAASSSVIVSGVLSLGSVALTPSWLT